MEVTVEAGGTSENSTPPTEENFEAEMEATEVEDSKIEAKMEAKIEVINELDLEDENEEVIHVVVEDFCAEAAPVASEAAKEVENVASIEVIEEQHIEVSLLKIFLSFFFIGVFSNFLLNVRIKSPLFVSHSCNFFDFPFIKHF